MTQPQKKQNDQLGLDEAKRREMLRNFERLELETRLPETVRELENENESLRRMLWRCRRVPSATVCYLLILAGVVSLVFSIALSSTVLVFVGLGLTFLGVRFLFIRLQKIVRSDLMDSTALSSLQAVDYFIDRLGYAEKGIYVPGNGNPGNAVVFVPSVSAQELSPAHDRMESPLLGMDGVVLVPPGLALADLLERELGEKFNEITLEELPERLRKVLVEDLEITDEFDMQIDGNVIRMKLDRSVYTGLCKKLKGKRICSMFGCPMCSALACVLTQTTGKPVVFQKGTRIEGTRIIVSEYHTIEDMNLWNQPKNGSATLSTRPFMQLLKP